MSITVDIVCIFFSFEDQCCTIGIEINNPGHEFSYNKFNPKQINSLKKLLSFLIKKYNIKVGNVLGHSDIAPDRKKDPGEKFPWEYLSKRNIGIWHDLYKKKLLKERNRKLGELDKNMFIQNLYKIGYGKKLKRNVKNFKILTNSFQRRFRQELINGIIDKECLIISKNLVTKFR